jgi:hypothetical protein
LKRLAGGLAVLCLVLFLLAIEQKHAVAVWETLRDEGVPAARRLTDETRRWASGETDSLEAFAAAVAEEDAVEAADATDAVLAGEFGPVDEATRAALGGVTFAGAAVRFDTGETFRTSPLRIATGREAFATGQTFADRLAAPAEAQIEVRRIVPASPGQAVRPSALCGGAAPALVALLHRGRHVDLMLFRAPGRLGGDAPAEGLCGVWRLRAR